MELMIGIASLGLALIVGAVLVIAPRQVVPVTRRRPKLDDQASTASPSPEWDAPNSAGRSRLGRLNHLNFYTEASLDNAGLNVSRNRFIRRVLGIAACVGVLSFLIGGALLSLALAGGVLVGARLMLGYLAGKRRGRFEDQLPDTLQLLSGSLRAGHSILRAIDAAANGADSPTSEEMRRVVSETSLGRDLLAALNDIAERMRNEDFMWVSQAIEINREVGGNLAEVLDQVNETIRERGEIKGHVRALAAEGKFSAYILMAMPVGIVGILAVVNPGYMSLLFTEPLGWAMLAASAVLFTAGGLWLRKLIDLKF